MTAASISSRDPILIYAKEAYTSQIKKSQEIKKVLGLRWIDLEGDGLIQLEPEGNGSRWWSPPQPLPLLDIDGDNRNGGSRS